LFVFKDSLENFILCLQSEMNVFIVGLPLRIGIGLITLYIMIPVFLQIITVAFDRMYGYVYLIIRSMAKG
ncbi:MAG TPA: flagellar biosynthetic protein FliR, partial [Bacillota bacterium]|nr:flagellar biosynthetic protein FliR [Bacillota bacterium]